MRIKLSLALMGALVFGVAGNACGAITTGSCKEKAYSISANAKGNAKTVSLVKEYLDGEYNSESYVYYFQTVLQRGQSYTIDVVVSGATDEARGKVFDVGCYAEDMGLEITSDFGDVLEDNAYDYRYVVTAKSWEKVDSDVTSLVCYLEASGESGGKFTAKFYTGVLGIPEGTEENPKVLVPGQQFQTVTGTLTDDHLGSYHFMSTLSAGRKYRFRTTSGTEDAPLTMTIYPEPENGHVFPTDDANVGYDLVSDEGGMYEFVVDAGNGSNAVSSVTLEYGAYPQRAISSHAVTNLSLNASRRFTPGRRNAAASDFYDTIIDESLFAFTATAGKRYVVSTSGAATNLVMELYDRSGETLAVNRKLSPTAHDARIAWTATMSGTYYIGVCEDVEEEESVSGKDVEVVVREADALDAALDAWDPADDTVATATPISPVYGGTDGQGPADLDVTGHGPHTLSARDWSDTFALAVRAGYAYSLRAAREDGAQGNFLTASVFTLSGSTEVAVAAEGDIEQNLQFSAPENGMCYVRLSAADPITLAAAPGLDGGPYTLHAAARASDGNAFGMLSVQSKGPAPSDGATWRIVSGTSGSEPNYTFGSAIPLPAGTTVTLSFSSVSGMTTPASTNVTVLADQTNRVVAVYSDTYDPGDDAQSGATWMSPRSEETVVGSRTLWAEDPADFFRFSGSVGSYYTFRLTEVTGAPHVEIMDGTGKVLASGARTARLGVTATGTYYVRVAHADANNPIDSSYRLSAFSAAVGSVAFSDNAAFTARKSATNAVLRLRRTTSEGALRIRYATYADTATPGEDYVPVTGEVAWADGDGADKEIVVRLIPKMRPESEGNKRFFVRIVSVETDQLEDGEYPAIVSGVDVATVTIEDATASRGAVAFVACGLARSAIPFDGLRLAPGEHAVLWLGRVGGVDGVAAVSATCEESTVGNFMWMSGTDDWKRLDIVASADVTKVETRTYRLVPKDVTTATSNAVLTVKIDPKVERGGVGALPALEGEMARLGSAYGSYRGVLPEENGITNGIYALADLAFTATATAAGTNLAATVRVAGKDMRFAADHFEFAENGYYGSRAYVTMTNTVEIGGFAYEQTLRLELPNLAGENWSPDSLLVRGEAELHLFLPAEDGISADEAVYAGMVYRDARDMPFYAAAAATFAGRYTAALIPEDLPFADEPKGNGFCTLDIAEDGSATLRVELANGRTFEAAGVASLDPDSDRDTAVVPFYWQEGAALFGGDLVLTVNDDGVPVIDTDQAISQLDVSSALIWRNDAPDAVLDGGRTVQQTLRAVGGWFDAALDPQAVAFGRSVTALTEGFDMFFEDSWERLGLAVDQATGLVTGTPSVDGEGRAFRGVNIQAVSDYGDWDGLFVSGYLSFPTNTAASAVWLDSYPLNVYLEETDNGWTEDFGFLSSIAFDGNGHTAGDVPTTMTDEVGQVRTIPANGADFARSGYEFLGWTDGVRTYREGDAITVPVTNLTLRADWTISVAGVAAALDVEDLTFRADGDAGWYVQGEAVKVGKEALRSGKITRNQSTWIETTVDGAGLLSFWYKISSEQTYDKLTVTVDGTAVGSFSGEVDWTRFELEIAEAGTHAVRWTYSKDSSGDKGEDAAWLDGLAFGPTVMVTYDAKGGAVSPTSERKVVGTAFGALPEATWDLYTFDGWTDAEGRDVTAESVVPDEDVVLSARWRAKEWRLSFDLAGGSAEVNTNRSAATGSAVTLPTAAEYGLAKAGYELFGWTLGDTVYAPGASYTVGASDVTFTAAWTFSVTGLAQSLDLPTSVTLATFGDAAWFGDATTTSPSGRTSARSGAIGNSQKTTLSLSFTGAGTLSFLYKVSTEANFDKLYVSTNGGAIAEGPFSGNIDWTTWKGVFPDGLHTVTFTYEKDSMTAGGEDAVWLAEVKWTPDRVATEKNAVPFAWLDSVYPEAIGSDAAGYEELAERVPSPFGKSVPLSYDYVAGTNPKDKDDFLRAEISVVDGKPSIGWAPDFGAKRVYRILGKKELGDERWDEISADAPEYRFFRVTVALPAED